MPVMVKLAVEYLVSIRPAFKNETNIEHSLDHWLRRIDHNRCLCNFGEISRDNRCIGSPS